MMSADTQTQDTIYALATAFGKSGVAIIRVSGPLVAQVVSAVAPGNTPEPRKAVMRNFVHPETGVMIDKGLLLYFKGPHSFTGEDCAEFQIHGSIATIEAIQNALSILQGVRRAEAGEFTRRAFDNGLMDLTQVDALADLIAAETPMQLSQALRQLGGGLSQLYGDWMQRLTGTLAYLEAAIDFVDGDEVDEEVTDAVLVQIKDILHAIIEHLDDQRRGERLRDGYKIAVVGPPNAGKSSFVNQLAQRDVAIVSSIAGTTRDILECHLNLGGMPVIVADTAGLRKPQGDEIEAIGIKRAEDWAQTADLKLLMFDGRDAETWKVFKAGKQGQSLIDAQSILIYNKADCLGSREIDVLKKDGFVISAKSGEGVPELLRVLTSKLQAHVSANTSPAITRERYRVALQECVENLNAAIEDKTIELRAEDLRLAVRSLGKVLGIVDVEDLLDIIFSDFCIGK